MTFVQTTHGNTQHNWAEYYRLRERARISLLAFAVAAFLLPIPLGILMTKLRLSVGLLLFFLILGIAAVVCAVPLFKWANWRCPRCGQRFAEPKVAFGFYSVIPVLWRLAVNSQCGSCKLACGEPRIGANSR